MTRSKKQTLRFKKDPDWGYNVYKRHGGDYLGYIQYGESGPEFVPAETELALKTRGRSGKLESTDPISFTANDLGDIIKFMEGL